MDDNQPVDSQPIQAPQDQDLRAPASVVPAALKPDPVQANLAQAIANAPRDENNKPLYIPKPPPPAPLAPQPKNELTAPEDQVEQKVLSGEYNLKKGTTVDVRDASGTSYNLPSEQLKDALDQGYHIETAKQKAIREYVQEHDNLAGDAQVALGQFANQALMGIPELVYDNKASPFDVEKKNALKDSHQLSNIFGGAGGFGASLVVGGPLFKVGTEAGEVASKVVAQQLAERGIKRGSESMAKDIVARMVTNAAQLGTEGVVISAPRAVTEAALGDPESAAESLLMGGAIGATLGVASGPTGKMLQGLNRFVKTKLNGAASEAVESFAGQEAGTAGQAAGENLPGKTTPDTLNPGDGTLPGALRATGAADEVIAQAEKGLQKIKPHANKIVEANERLGITTPAAELSSDPVVQSMDSALSKSDTAVGHARAREVDNHFDTYDKELKGALQTDSANQSAYETGESIKKKLIDEAQASIKPVSEMFNEAGVEYEKIPLNQKSLDRVANNIESLKEVRGALGGETEGIAKKVVASLRSGDLETLDDLKRMRTNVFGAISKTAAGETYHVAGVIGDKLLNLEDSHADRMMQNLLEKASVPGESTLQKMDRIQAAMEQMKQAREKWKALAEHFTDASDALGAGRIKSPRDFIANIKDLSGEEMVKKFLPKNDVASMRTLQKKFPDHFNTVVQFEKAKFLNEILQDGQISPRKFMTKYKKMSPEMSDVLFGEANQRIRDVQTSLEAKTPDMNPSGTAKTLSYLSHMGSSLGEKGIVGGMMDFIGGHAKDAVTAHQIRRSVSVEGVFGANKAIIQTRTMLERIPQVVDDLYEGVKDKASKIEPSKAVSAIMRLVDDDSKSKSEVVDDLRKNLSAKSANPTATADHLANLTEGLSKTGAPMVAAAFSAKASTALNYLNDSIPKPEQPETPFYKPVYKPTDAELASFERKLSVVMDPSVALHALQNNSLTQDHIEALQVVYPKIYDAMRGRVLNHLMENPKSFPYQARLKLSTFMGMDIDQTSTPENVKYYQDLYTQQPSADTKGDGLNQSGLNKMNLADAVATKTQKLLSK